MNLGKAYLVELIAALLLSLIVSNSVAVAGESDSIALLDSSSIVQFVKPIIVSNNMGSDSILTRFGKTVPVLLGIDVGDNPPYGRYLSIDYCMEDASSAKRRRGIAVGDMLYIYSRVYMDKNMLEYAHVVVSGYLRVTDKYGNDSLDVGYIADVDSSLARKIKWENISIQQFWELLDDEGRWYFAPVLYSD